MPNAAILYVLPSVTAPATYTIAMQATTAISGIGIVDPYERAAGTPMTVVLGDLAGQLGVAPVAGVQESGLGTTQVTLTGSLAGLNAALGSLTYEEPFARMQFDFLSIAATDDRNNSTYAQIQVGPGTPSGDGLACDFGVLTMPLPGNGVGGAAGDTEPGRTLRDDGQSVDLHGGEGDDTIIASTGNDTITSGGGHNLIGLGSGRQLLYSTGSGTIIGGSHSDTVFASGNSLAFGGSGGMLFVNGGGDATVVGGTGTGSDVISGGQGGGLFAGGSGGDNVILAGQQSSTIFGAGGGDLLMAAGSAPDVMIAGSGNETLSGAGSSGANTFFAGSGNDLLGGGAGNETFIGGTGSETVLGGSGADLYGFISGLSSGGSDLILGFDPDKGDRIMLGGYGAAEQAHALASQQVSGAGTSTTLSDHTEITFAGIAGLTGADFA